jgi:mRNA-degrading endonuclease toxin of MazEF toxin-antitoxin module
MTIMTVQFGQIVWAEIADANGMRKLRPAVVITPSQQVTASGPIHVVAITSRLTQPLPSDHVLLPWHAQGHPRTGLNRKCAAVCSWLARITSADIQSTAGIIPGKTLAEILGKIAATNALLADANDADLPKDDSAGEPSEEETQEH